MTAKELVEAGRWNFPVDSLCKAAEVIEGLSELYHEAKENPEKYVNHKNRTCAGIARHTIAIREHRAQA